MKRLLAVLVVLLISTTAYAKKKTGPGTKAVKKANDTIAALLAKKVEAGSEEEKALAAEVTSSVRGFLDIDELGKRAMADHWESLTEAQRTEFLSVLRGLIEDNYVKGLRANLEYKVEYKGEAKQDDGTLLVKTVIKTKRRGRAYSIKVDYRLRKDGKTWRCYDVMTDGVGLVENYRAQFNKIVAKDGFDGLIAKMKKKRAA
jgi:phospholipid transport system substrate-binding protein